MPTPVEWEIRKLILQEIDTAIKNTFQQNPEEWSEMKIAVAWNHRNNIAYMFGLLEVWP